VKQGRLKVYFEGLKVRSSLDLDQGKIGLGISPDDLGIVLFAIGQLDQLIYNRGILRNLRLPVEICEVLGGEPWIP